MSFNVDPTSLRGHTVVLTGKVLGIGRGQMHAIIARAGGTASDRVDATTTLLVAENPASGQTTTKFKAAAKRRIPIIAGETFRKVLEGRLEIGVAVSTHTVGPGVPPTPSAAMPNKPDKRAQRQRDATVRQLEQLAAAPSQSPYAVAF